MVSEGIRGAFLPIILVFIFQSRLYSERFICTVDGCCCLLFFLLLVCLACDLRCNELLFTHSTTYILGLIIVYRFGCYFSSGFFFYCRFILCKSFNSTKCLHDNMATWYSQCIYKASHVPFTTAQNIVHK